MSKNSCPVPEKISLNYHLFHRAKVEHSLRHLLLDISRAAKYISYAIQTTDTGLSGGTNQFGEEQVKLDVLSDDIIRQHLCESELVATYISEEQSEIVELSSDAPYSVVFDPLDGSSLVEVNFAIGSIFGVYEGSTVIGKTPRSQVAALYVIYGPRTLLVYSTGDGVHEFLLNDVGEFVLQREFLGIADEAKNFSPGNLKAIIDNEPYKKVVLSWFEEKSLRYSGCMVADMHHIVSKGQGVFSYVGGSKFPNGKLRHVFECGPFAYLVHQAGGFSSDGIQDILDKPITDIDQRTPFLSGSANEVQKMVSVLSE